MPAPKTVNRVADVEILLHLQFGEPDIHAIDVRKDVAQKQERNEMPSDFAVHPFLEGRVTAVSARAPAAVNQDVGAGDECSRV